MYFCWNQALRNVDEDARLCYLLIHMLLLKPQDFKSRVQEFVKEVCIMGTDSLNAAGLHRGVFTLNRELKDLIVSFIVYFTEFSWTLAPKQLAWQAHGFPQSQSISRHINLMSFVTQIFIGFKKKIIIFWREKKWFVQENIEM